jgi:hypothetical protein
MKREIGSELGGWSRSLFGSAPLLLLLSCTPTTAGDGHKATEAKPASSAGAVSVQLGSLSNGKALGRKRPDASVGGTGGSALDAAGTGGSSGAGGTGGTGSDGSAVDADSGSEVVFAMVGDFGVDNEAENRVATLIKSWNPAFVVTLGDNNYGRARAIDREIGKYYASFIGNYTGAYGPGSPTNRFWPSVGNHDWDSSKLQAYLDYFTLPGNERYYQQVVGRVHLFAVDSDDREPDGNTATSVQGQWLQAALAASTACHKIVYFHEPPYTSGTGNGASTFMRWPFMAWGATAVITGHEHIYERLQVDGIPYIVNGLGGDSLYQIGTPVPESQVRYNAKFGAMRVVASATSITYELWTVDQEKIDTHVVATNCP